MHVTGVMIIYITICYYYMQQHASMIVNLLGYSSIPKIQGCMWLISSGSYTKWDENARINLLSKGQVDETCLKFLEEILEIWWSSCHSFNWFNWVHYYTTCNIYLVNYN